VVKDVVDDVGGESFPKASLFTFETIALIKR
jgi:hypothetical protein